MRFLFLRSVKNDGEMSKMTGEVSRFQKNSQMHRASAILSQHLSNLFSKMSNWQKYTLFNKKSENSREFPENSP
jgi:hypothetical protein